MRQVKLIVEMNDYGTFIECGEFRRYVPIEKHSQLRSTLQSAYSLMTEHDLIEYRDSRSPARPVSHKWFRNAFKLFKLIKPNNNNSLKLRHGGI